MARWRCRSEAGATSLEYLGVLVLAVAVVSLIITSNVGASIADAAQAAVCRVIGDDCAAGEQRDDDDDEGRRTRIAALEERAERRQRALDIEGPDAAGSRYADLHERIAAAMTRGDLDTAEALDAQLELAIRLARGPDLRGSDRGRLLEDLWVPPSLWEQALAAGTIYLPPDGDNLRFFDAPAAPGDGLLVLDFFTPFATSGQPPARLEGDDRDFHPGGPLSTDLRLQDSRIIVLVDRETGRGVIYQSHTCNDFYGQCREARPIALDTGERTQFVPELSDPVHGPYIAPTNRYEITGDDQSVTLTYDVLNSMTWPVFSVDGTVTLTRDSRGTYTLTGDDRDTYPSIGIYQYRPGQEPHIIDEAASDPVSPGAVPEEWQPWVPGFD